MKYTNKHNLPESVVNAILNDPYVGGGDISVTSLIKPPQMRVLEYIHREEVEEDVADSVWRLFGQAIHSVLEKNAPKGAESEKRLETEINGWRLSGQADLLHNGVLTDYKVTSVYSYLMGDKPAWEQQLNILKFIFERNGHEVRELEIVAILRDWTASKAGGATSQDYPPSPVVRINIPAWLDSRITEYLRERIALHQEAEKLHAGELPDCTPQERWERPTTYAVKKEGARTAYRVFDDADKAHEESEKRGMIVEVRRGENIRCERYCRASQWCEQFSKIKIQG